MSGKQNKWLDPGQLQTSADAMGRLVRGHMPALDGLRGLAIVLVLAHAFDVIQTRGGPGHQVGLWLDLGWIGVQLFFVLSGFLITGILLDTKDQPHHFRKFWIRRALRIFPLYYGALALALSLGHGEHMGWLLTYTQNYGQSLGYTNEAFPHFWSLAVEEQFYLVWPIIVWLVGRRGVIALAAALVPIAIVSRIVARGEWGHDAAYMFTPCRMDALALGAAAAALIRGDRLRREIARTHATRLGILGGALALAGAVLGHLLRTGETMQTAGYTLIALGFAILLVAVLPAGNVVDGRESGVPARIFAFAPLRRVGTYSYGMYVFHAPLHFYVGLPLLARIAPSPGTAAGLVYALAAAVATFACAALSYHLYERWFLDLKKRFAP